MLGVCFTLWQTGWPEWSIGYLWSTLDWISRLDVYALALILIYVIVLVRRASYRYRQACLESRAGRLPARAQRTLTADLSRRVRILRSIASAAPYLGLAGTCLGILDLFRGVGGIWLTTIWANIAASLLTTASGVLVALSAATSYNYLLWLIDKLESRSTSGPLISSRFPLTRRFSTLPAFALVAAPTLAIAAAAYTSLWSCRVPLGLPVRLLRPGELVRSDSGELETSDGSLARPIFIGLVAINSQQEPNIYVNSMPTTWNDLDGSLWNKLKARSQTTVYVRVDDDVRWTYVAAVIDSARTHSYNVVLLTVASEFSVGHVQVPRHKPRP